MPRRIIACWLCAWIGLALATQFAHAQTAPRHYLSAATNNATLVYGRPGVVNLIHAVNTTATIYYLKLYNKATAPVCGTDVPVLTVPLPPVTAPPPPVQPSGGLRFPLGVGFCIVAGIADNDNASAATGIALNLGVSGQ